MSLEGTPPWHIQIKSRVHLSGEFPVHEAIDHILKVWKSHLDRNEPRAQLAVVFERDIKGEQLPSRLHGLGATTGESLPEDSKLLQSLRSKGKASGISEIDIDALLPSTVFAVCPWDAVTEETLDCLRELDGLSTLPPSSLIHIALLLRVEIGDASNENASRTHGERRSLSRTEIVGKIQEFASQIDLDSLEAAIRDGVCEPLDLGEGELLDSNRFYEGVATQPFHVASGLVVRRPDVINQIKSGLEQKSAVVIAGPSGVGKSAVLWTIPDEMPNVLWFRVRRLAPDDVSSIVRLARAYNASAQNPIGFLVDSAGSGDFRGWSQLRTEAAAVQGILLVASARNEDLPLLGDMAECSTVEIRLDERTAQMIHAGLAERGATAAPHWQEAFEDADGLTLEFTHLLTSGMRLRDLIDDQVNQRMTENRHNEISVLALVSAADRWSAEVSVSDIAAACDLSDLEMREALDRLRAEHLVVERNGWIGGLHRLRSTAICDSIHDRPPPTLEETIKTLLPHIPTPQLHRFTASMLNDNPDARDIIISFVGTGSLNLDRLAACMQGIRLADFSDLAENWNRIAEQHNIPVSVRRVLFTFAVGRLEPLGQFPDEFHSAWETMINAPEQDSRSNLISAVGWDQIVEFLVSATSTVKAQLLLAVLDGADPEFATSVESVLGSEVPLVLAMQEAPLESLAELLATAYDVEPRLAQALVAAMGGEQCIIERIRVNNPWTTQLEIQERNGNPVGFARLLHVSDSYQQDPEGEVIAMAKTLLKCLPRIESIDVQALLAGNQELRVHGFAPCARQFKRDKAQAVSGTVRNQARLRAACALLGEPDTTRLSKTLPLLQVAHDLVLQIGTAIVTGRRPDPDFDRQRSVLHEKGRNIRPSHRQTQTNSANALELKTPELNDDLYGLITDITGNVIPRLIKGPGGYRALASYITDTVIEKHLNGAANEPWHLIGLEDQPSVLNSLRSALEDLSDLVDELASGKADPERIQRSALAGTETRALQRAADTCRTAKKRKSQQRREEVQRRCREAHSSAEVYDVIFERGAREYCVHVELDTLFDWFGAADQLAASLDQGRLPEETFLFVPLRQGRPVPNMTRRLSDDLRPVLEPKGLGRLSEAHPDELAGIFDKAQKAIQTLSGICCLTEEQQAHQAVQDVADAAESDMLTAWDKLSGLPDGPVVDWLRSIIHGLAVRVQAECDGTSSEAGFAAEIAKSSLTDELTDYLALVLEAQCIALEWEIDPVSAAGLLPENDD